MTEHQGPQDRPAWPFGSKPCMTGEHEDCGHLGSIGFGPGDGGRPALTLFLCRCGCHSACPLDGRPAVSRSVWVGLCDCPGTELAEGRLDEAAREAPDFPDSDRLLRSLRDRQENRDRERQQKREEMRAAWDAARTAAAGKNRAQIREIYVAELRARSLTVPSGPLLDAAADAIARNREKISAVHSGRLLAEIGRELWKTFSPFTE
jgi:hypothetical protein